MEAVLLIGIQATGKSTFYQQHFADTHIRINLDMLRTRHRESILLGPCLEMKQPFVVDNTNLTIVERARYIAPARQASFRVLGYYFRSSLKDAMQRNESRVGKQRIPEVGIRAAHRKLEQPSRQEEFDLLYYVRIDPDNQFIIEEWQDDF